MATATATLFHSFPSRKGDHVHDDSGNDDSQVGLSITPNPSPHTTLTPFEAASLSTQAKCVVRDGNTHVDTAEAAQAISPSPDGHLGNILSNGIENVNLGDATKGGTDLGHQTDRTNDAVKTNERSTNNEQKFEARIARLEKNLESLLDVCQNLIRQQQVRKNNNNLCLDEDTRELVKQMVTEELKKLGLFDVYRQVSCGLAVLDILESAQDSFCCLRSD